MPCACKPLMHGTHAKPRNFKAFLNCTVAHARETFIALQHPGEAIPPLPVAQGGADAVPMRPARTVADRGQNVVAPMRFGPDAEPVQQGDHHIFEQTHPALRRRLVRRRIAGIGARYLAPRRVRPSGSCTSTCRTTVETYDARRPPASHPFANRTKPGASALCRADRCQFRVMKRDSGPKSSSSLRIIAPYAMGRRLRSAITAKDQTFDISV